MTTKYTTNFGLALPDFREGPWHDLINNDLSKIDQLIYGAFSVVDAFPWANATHYTVGITVVDPDTTVSWMCNIDHTSSASPVTFAAERAAHPTYWVQLISGFAPRGEWANNTNYYPYDLAYDSHLGIFAQCKQKHVSNGSGNIKDDGAFWYFIVDFSTIDLTTAASVSYSGAVSGIPKTNVQEAIDYLETQIIALNNVNVAQGNEITALHDAIDATNASITALSALCMKLAGNQTTTGGFKFTSFNITPVPATLTPDPFKGNYQYLSNTAAFILSAPTSDCAIDLLVRNSATAGAITFAGFSTSISPGDALTTTNGHRFIISIRRIDTVSTYVVKALQ